MASASLAIPPSVDLKGLRCNRVQDGHFHDSVAEASGRIRHDVCSPLDTRSSSLHYGVAARAAPMSLNRSSGYKSSSRRLEYLASSMLDSMKKKMSSDTVPFCSREESHADRAKWYVTTFHTLIF